MSILTWPVLSRAAPRLVRWGLTSNTMSFNSPLSGAMQTVEMPGARWRCSFTMENLVEADAALLQALLVQLRGQANRLLLHNFARPTPRGTATGTPLVNGASQTGVSLITDGWTAGITALRTGDFFGVNGELKMVTADAVADGSGNCTISFEPPLRSSPADNAALTTTKPLAIFMLSSPDSGWDTQPYRLSNVPIDLVENWS